MPSAAGGGCDQADEGRAGEGDEDDRPGALLGGEVEEAEGGEDRHDARGDDSGPGLSEGGGRCRRDGRPDDVACGGATGAGRPDHRHEGDDDGDGEAGATTEIEGFGEILTVLRIHPGADEDGGDETDDAGDERCRHPVGAASCRVALRVRDVTPHAPADEADEHSRADEGSTDGVRAGAIGVVELPDAGEAEGDTDDDTDEAGRVHHILAAEVEFVDGEHDKREAGEGTDGVHPVAGVPDVLVADPLPGEDLVEQAVSLVADAIFLGVDGEVVELADLNLIDDQLRETELGALQNEEGPQGHDEARERCSVDEEAVPPTESKGGEQRDRKGDPETETCAGCLAGDVADQQDGQDAERARGGARREIEFAADHQQRDGDRHDAKRCGGLVEDRLGTTGLAELDRDGPEENPHSDSANGCTDLGSNECSLEDPSVRQPLVGVRGCAGPGCGVTHR